MFFINTIIVTNNNIKRYKLICVTTIFLGILLVLYQSSSSYFTHSRIIITTNDISTHLKNNGIRLNEITTNYNDDKQVNYINDSKIVDTAKSVLVERNQSIKYILYWTPMFDREDFYLGLGFSPFKHCEIKNCFATYNKSVMPVENFDAVMFHGYEFSEDNHGTPGRSRKNQIYIYSTMESPLWSYPEVTIPNFFNWTMTYRRDSDVLNPYGRIIKKETNYTLPTLEFVANKTRFAAWFSSNCDTKSNREHLGRRLQELIPLDIYGKCGDLICPRENDSYCYDLLEKNYKFYLSFENSYCRDYVTEKLFLVLERNVVPIVYGGVDYATIAPPKSVINVEDFDNVKALVDYLTYLNETPSEYIKYFDWKKHFVIDNFNSVTKCDLCKKLNEPVVESIYKNINSWWESPNNSMCRSAESLPTIIRSLFPKARQRDRFMLF